MRARVCVGRAHTETHLHGSEAGSLQQYNMYMYACKKKVHARPGFRVTLILSRHTYVHPHGGTTAVSGAQQSPLFSGFFRAHFRTFIHFTDTIHLTQPNPNPSQLNPNPTQPHPHQTKPNHTPAPRAAQGGSAGVSSASCPRAAAPAATEGVARTTPSLRPAPRPRGPPSPSRPPCVVLGIGKGVRFKGYIRRCTWSGIWIKSLLQLVRVRIRVRDCLRATLRMVRDMDNVSF